MEGPVERTSRTTVWLRVTAVCVFMLALLLNLQPVRSVRAEGTNDMQLNSLNKRALTEFRNSTTAGLYRRTWLRVYAKAGETILMGSSGVNVGSGDIWLWKPNRITDSQMATASIPAADLTCKSAQPNKGLLTTRTQEQAGPLPNSGGYDPCVYTATEAGVYWIAMIGPAGITGTTDGTSGTITAPNVTTTQNAGVSMWDITVRNNSGVAKPGRVFVDYLAMLAGGNGPLSCTGASSYCQFSTLYAVASDGFKYKIDLNGLDPNGYILYGNSVGFLDPDGKTPLYHDMVATDNTLGTILGGVKQSPATAKLFFSTPSADLPTTIVPTPSTPSIANVTFSGSAGGTAATYSVGGQFTYTGNVGGIAEIVISRDGANFDPTLGANRVLRAVTAFGSSVINWDGKDNSGAYFPTGGPYYYKASMHAGEYHFPLLDAENSAFGGPTLTLLNPIGGTCPYALGCSTAFYDDRSYTTTTGVLVNPSANPSGNAPPNPLYANPATGFDSSTAQRKWGDGTANGFGNWKGLDLWTYFPSAAVQSTLTVVAGVSQDLRIQKSHTGAFTPGSSASYTLRVANAGTTAISGAVSVGDALPAGLTYVSGTGTGWTCSASSQTVTCNATASSLAAGASMNDITLTVSVGTSAAPSVTNTATVSFSGDGNAGNNTASDPTVIESADLAVTKSVSPTTVTAAGQSVTFNVLVTNNGPSTASGVQVTDLLPAGLTYGSYTASQGAYVSGAGVWSVGSMPSGSTATLSIVATVNAVSCGGQIVNTASRTASSLYDYVSSNDSGSATLTLSGIVSLSGVVTEAGTGVPIVGAAVQLTDSASHVYNTTTGANGAYSFPGAPSTIALGSAILLVTKTGYANSTTTPNIALCGSNTANVQLGTANLLVTKSDGKTTIVGTNELLDYTVTVQNIGTIDATAVYVVDTLNRNLLAFQGDSIPTVPRDTVDNPDGTTTRTYGPFSTLVPTASFSFIVHTQVLPPGTTAVWNKASASTASPEADVTNNEFTDTDPVATAPDLKITNDDGRTIVQQGQTGVTYNLTYGNDGNVGATGVTVTDVLDPDVTYTGCTGGTSCSYNEATHTVTWVVGSVPVGATGSLSVTVSVNPDAAVGSVIANTATIDDDHSHGADSNPSNNTAPESDVVVAPEIVLEKSISSAITPPAWDGQVTFVLTYTNRGAVTAKNVIITDPLPDGTAFFSASAVCSQSPVPVTCSVGDVAPGASGSVQVVVTVAAPTSAATQTAATLTSESSPGSVVVTTSTGDANLLAKWTDLDPTMTAGWNANPRLAAFDDSLSSGWDQPIAGFGEEHWTDATRINAQWVATTIAGMDHGNYTFFRKKFCVPLNATGLSGALEVANDDYGDQYVNQVGFGTKIGAGEIVSYDISAGLQAGGNLYAVRLLNNTHGGHAMYSNMDHPGLAGRVTASYAGLAPFAAAPAVTMAKAPIDFTMVPAALGGITPFEYQVDFGDATASQDWTSATTINHTYTAAGNYTAVVTARDAWGCTATDLVPITVLPVERNLLANTATVDAQNGYGVHYGGQAAAGISLLSLVDLGITKSSSPKPVYAGEPIVYTLNITNNGANSLGQVRLTDALPSVQGAVYQASTGTFDPATGIWTGTLGKSDWFVLTITGVVDPMAAAGPLNNTAGISPVGGSDANPSNDSFTDPNSILRRADLGVTISTPPGAFTPGQQQTFTVVVTNNGTSGMDSFNLALLLPAMPDAIYTPSLGSYNPVSGQWTGVTFGPNQELTLIIVGTIPWDFGGNLVATATVTPPSPVTDGVSANNSSTVTRSPTAVSLESLSATVEGSGVLVAWTTAQETDNQGFNLWRGTSPAGPDVKLNAAIIPSKAPGGGLGASYQFVDTYQLTSGATYYYWLEDVSLGGVVTRHEPASVTYTGPTAVTLAEFSAAAAAPLLTGAVGLALAALAGLALLRRRDDV